MWNKRVFPVLPVTIYVSVEFSSKFSREPFKLKKFCKQWNKMMKYFENICSKIWTNKKKSKRDSQLSKN